MTTVNITVYHRLSARTTSFNYKMKDIEGLEHIEMITDFIKRTDSRITCSATVLHDALEFDLSTILLTFSNVETCQEISLQIENLERWEVELFTLLACQSKLVRGYISISNKAKFVA